MSEVTSFQELIEGLEKCVAEQLAIIKRKFTKLDEKFSKQIKEVENNIKENEKARYKEDINSRLESMEKRIDIHERITETKLNDFQIRLTDITKEALSAALQSIEDNSERTPHLTSTPLQKDISAEDQTTASAKIITPEPIPSTSRHGLFNMTVNSPSTLPTGTFYGSEEALSEENQRLLEPKNDKLTRRQRALFKYFLQKHEHDRINDHLVSMCITEGTEMGIWEENCCPEGVADLSRKGCMLLIKPNSKHICYLFTVSIIKNRNGCCSTTKCYKGLKDVIEEPDSWTPIKGRVCCPTDILQAIYRHTIFSGRGKPQIG